MIKTAVILAAGLGSRLKERTKEKPKGFLVIDDQTLIERSIKKLIGAGIEEIIIGTGYLNGAFDELAKKNLLIKCLKNEKYENTGSMFTLFNARDLIKRDFLLLESDLLYEETGLRTLLNDVHNDVILASGATKSGDEVFIETDKNNFLLNMSKKPEELKNISAELVGISKVSYSTFFKMCSFAEKEFEKNAKLDYEYTMVAVSNENPFFVKKIEKYAWIEIDDENHLNRALNVVYPLIKERESMLKIKRNVLLNPGPATTTDSVKYAQVVPDICPREKEFGEIMEFVSLELTKFVANTDEYISVIFGGSGTAVVEAIISSVVDNDAILVINNGAYGERMCQMARVYDYNLIEFKSPNDYPLDYKAVEEVIKNSKDKISHLAVVHNETTTGLLNDLYPLGELCKKYNIKMIVDAMSSYSAIPIDMKKMNIHFLCASSNKLIQAMAGVGFVIAKKTDLEATKNVKMRNLYLNLYAQYEYFKKNYQMRFTPPVQIMYALRQAIIEAKLEGIENRYARISKSWETLINGLERLGLKYLVPKKNHGKIITSVIEPKKAGYNFDKMHDYFLEKGFTIYPGKVSNADCFRIANIGQIDYKDMEKFLVYLEEYMKSL